MFQPQKSPWAITPGPVCPSAAFNLSDASWSSTSASVSTAPSAREVRPRWESTVIARTSRPRHGNEASARGVTIERSGDDSSA